MRFTWSQTITLDRAPIIFCVIGTLFYFGLVFPSLFYLGFPPLTTYYEYTQVTSDVVVWVIALNTIFLGAVYAAMLLLVPKKVDVRIVSNWLFVLVAVLVIYALNRSNLGMDRESIKESSNLAKVVISSISVTYLGAIALCETDKKKLVLAFGAIFFSLIAAGERETIIYLMFPIILRLGSQKRGLVKVILLGVGGGIFFASYKLLFAGFRQVLEHGQSLSQLPKFVAAESGFWTYVGTSLLRDNIHKSSMEIFYFLGDAPNYNVLSYFMPIQIGRVLDSSVLTNGNLATLYYTNGVTGTGFSALLESWLNFWAFGPLLLAFGIGYFIRRTAEAQNALLLVGLLVFLAKLVRSDLWPSVIGYMLGPILIVACGKLLMSMYSVERFRAKSLKLP